MALGAALGDDLDAPVDQTSRHALDGRRDRPVRSGAAGGRRSRSASTCRRRPNSPAASPRSAWSSAPTARGSRPAQARPAAGLARRRPLALGRLCRRRPCADRRGAPAGRSAAGSSDIDGELAAARAAVEDKRKAVEAAQADLTAAAAAEAAAREHWRAAQREADSARELHAAAEREVARNAARISALTEAKTRLIAGRDEAQAAAAEAERALAAAALGRSGKPARRRPRRHRRQARRARRGARRGAGAGARGRARRPPARRHRHRPAGLERAPRRRDRPDRHARRPQRRGQAASAPRSPTRRRSSPRSAAR